MVENSEIPNSKDFTVTEHGVTRDGLKTHYMADIYKLTRSCILQISPIQTVHIINQIGTVDEDIEMTEQDMANVFRGRAIMYIDGMYDPINHHLRIKQHIQDQGW